MRQGTRQAVFLSREVLLVLGNKYIALVPTSIKEKHTFPVAICFFTGIEHKKD